MSLVTDGIGGRNIITEGFGAQVTVIIIPPSIVGSPGGGPLHGVRRPTGQIRVKLEFPINIKSDLIAPLQSKLNVKSTLKAEIDSNFAIKGTFFKKLTSMLGIKSTLSKPIKQTLNIKGGKDYKELIAVLSAALEEIEEEEE